MKNLPRCNDDLLIQSKAFCIHLIALYVSGFKLLLGVVSISADRQHPRSPHPDNDDTRPFNTLPSTPSLPDCVLVH